MSDVLLYQTSDPHFADVVVDVLTRDGISCSKYGRGYADMSSGMLRSLGNGISIYIANAADLSRANSILLDLGAAVDTPPRFPALRLVILLIVVGTLLGAYVASHWK